MNKKFDNLRSNYSPANPVSANQALPYKDADFATRFGRPRSPRRKKSSWFFILLAVVMAMLAMRYLYLNIKSSVDYQIPGFVADQLTNNAAQKSIEDLKNSDTDQDGLNDYQESYQYRTSIFLPDSDSDGFSDFEEVTSGDDALCPRGQECNLLALITPKTKLAEVVQDISLDPNISFQDAVAEEFKKFLIDSGIPKEQVDQLTSEELAIMMDALANSGLLDENALSATTTPQEIRNFLLSQPNVSPEQINKLSDEDLLKIKDKILAK